MSDFDFLKKDDLYFQYFNIGHNSYHNKVRFYEEHIDELTYLERDHYHEVRIDYVLALFEIGRYGRFLREVDEVIELVIAENIFEYDGENIFNLLLRKKTACYINLNKPNEALPIISQLLRLDPDNTNLNYFFFLCNRKISQGNEDIIKGLAIISLMTGLSLKLAQTFVVDPFFSNYLATVAGLATTFFVVGATLLVGNEAYRRWYIKSKISQIRKK